MNDVPHYEVLVPGPAVLSDAAALAAFYAPADRAVPTLRVNFISSIDGSATADGLSGGLGGPADKAVFDTLRGVADVVLVGAGTARDEGYGALTTPDRMRGWRRANGLPEHPAMALVSGRLDLDPASALFAEAPTPPLVFTTGAAPRDARERLSEVATVIEVGEQHVDVRRVVEELTARGLRQVLCEGGPSLFGSLIAADAVDELCLTTSPQLEGGAGPRIAASHGATSGLRPMRLASLLHAGEMLLARWEREDRRDR